MMTSARAAGKFLLLFRSPTWESVPGGRRTLELTEQRKRGGIDPQAAAIEALSFITSDQKLMTRFLDLPGTEADGTRQAAAEPGFLVGVLNFLLGTSRICAPSIALR